MLALADKVVDAVKSGAIKKFVVMAGCDGRMRSREYYTDFASALPGDTVILTAGCAKYRYNKLPLGDIGGIPRVLGPTLPAFLSPNVLKVLADKFGLGTISTVGKDMKNLIYENNDGKHVPEGIGDAVRG